MHGLERLLRPSFIRNEIGCLRINEEFGKVIMAVGYPRTIREGWLDKIICSEGSFDLSMHITPSGIDSVITRLNQELVKQEADLLSAQMKGIVNPSLRIQQQDTLKVLERLQKGEEKLFSLSLYLNARAGSMEKLELLCRKIFSELNSIMIIPKLPLMRMQEGLKSILPLQDDRLGVSREITSDALSACFPFTTAFYSPDCDGVMLGFNRASGVPIILDAYSLPNHNGLILGTSGGGKSVTAKLFIMRNLMRGVRTIIVDPQGEYVRLCEKYGGQLIALGPKGQCAINPFDLMGMQPDEKIPSLLEFLKILLGGISEEQEIFLANTLPKIYAKAQNPTLSNLYSEIILAKKSQKARPAPHLEALESRMRPFIAGPFSFLNAQTKISVDGHLACFDISAAPEQLKPAIMFLAMDFVYIAMKNSPQKKLLVIDEAWSLLRFGKSAEHIFALVKTARKFGLSVVIITQEAEDLLSSPAGKTILANTAWKFFARQEASIIEELGSKFRLNPDEKSLLLTAAPGEGLLFCLNDHIPLRVVPSPGEYELVTTSPDEVRKFAQKSPHEDMRMCTGGQLQNPEKASAKRAQSLALIRLAEAQVRKYTDSVSQLRGVGFAGLVFFGPAGSDEDEPDCYAIAAPCGNEDPDFGTIQASAPSKPDLASRKYRQIFLLCEASAQPTGKAGSLVPVTAQGLAQKLNDIFE